MRPERILLPVEITKCSAEVFCAANAFAGDSSATVTLLHVVTLNISAPEKRVYEELGRDARWYLEQLARVRLRPGLATIIRVRFGKPAEEILAEAAACNIELIILPSHLPSFWDRLLAPVLPRVVEQVIRKAPCGVILMGAKNRFNCEKIWGRPGDETDAALLDHLDGALETKTSPVSLTEHAWASTREQHCAAA